MKKKSNKRTLENPLLYKKFLNAIEKNNPDLEFDPAYIDRTLEYDEAFGVLQGVYPGIKLSTKSHEELDYYRDYLCDSYSLCDKRLQDYIINELDKPFTDDELGQISYALFGRSEKAIALDKKRKAPITTDIRKYAKNPNRLDLKGLDNV
jgi:hypothetical protein